MNIIVVEDHFDLRDAFVDYLSDEGFNVVGASCGEELDEQLALTTTDLIILDVNLPGESGFDIAKRLRSAHPEIHIIMLTALGAESDRITGYDHGADLYLVKPISPLELTAAVKAVNRRIDSAVDRGTELTLNLSAMTLISAVGGIDLSASDIALVKALSLAPSRRLPYWRLYEVTDRPQEESSKGQLELQIFRLRKKFIEIGVSDKIIKSIRNEGYQLTLPIRIEN